jgi:hypothetical protein
MIRVAVAQLSCHRKWVIRGLFEARDFRLAITMNNGTADWAKYQEIPFFAKWQQLSFPLNGIYF